MKKMVWLIVGIFAGMEIKKQLDKNPNAQALLADATARGKELAETATEAFLDRTAELTGTPRPAKPAAKKTAARKPATKKPTVAKKPAAKKSPATKPSTK
jgi:precorrin-6x reductase